MAESSSAPQSITPKLSTFIDEVKSGNEKNPDDSFCTRTYHKSAAGVPNNVNGETDRHTDDGASKGDKVPMWRDLATQMYFSKDYQGALKQFNKILEHYAGSPPRILDTLLMATECAVLCGIHVDKMTGLFRDTVRKADGLTQEEFLLWSSTLAENSPKRPLAAFILLHAATEKEKETLRNKEIAKYRNVLLQLARQGSSYAHDAVQAIPDKIPSVKEYVWKVLYAVRDDISTIGDNVAIANAAYALGLVQSAVGDYEQAIAEYEVGVILMSTVDMPQQYEINGGLHQSLACAYKRLGGYEEALYEATLAEKSFEHCQFSSSEVKRATLKTVESFKKETQTQLDNKIMKSKKKKEARRRRKAERKQAIGA